MEVRGGWEQSQGNLMGRLENIDETDAHEFSESQGYLLETLIRTVENKLVQECQQVDGVLSSEKIQEFCSQIRDNSTIKSRLIQRVILEFLAWRQEKPKGERRGSILNRMVTSRFENLLVHQIQKETISTHIPRRACTGLLEGLRKLVGKDNYDSLNEDAIRVMKKVGEPDPDGSYSREHWEELYATHDAQKILVHFETHLSLAFGDYRRNKIWLIDSTNTYLDGLTSSLIEPGTGRWRFREIHFVEVMKRFVDDLETRGSPDTQTKSSGDFSNDIRTFADNVYDDLRTITEDGLDFR